MYCDTISLSQMVPPCDVYRRSLSPQINAFIIMATPS